MSNKILYFNTKENELICKTAVLQRINFWNNEYKKRYLVNKHWEEIIPYVQELNTVIEYFNKNVQLNKNIFFLLDDIYEHLFIFVYFKNRNEKFIDSWIHLDKDIQKILIGHFAFYKKYRLFPHQVISIFNMVGVYKKYIEAEKNDNIDKLFLENLNQYNSIINFFLNYENNPQIEISPNIRDLSLNDKKVSITIDIEDRNFNLENISNEAKFKICLIRYIRNTIIEGNELDNNLYDYLYLNYYLANGNIKNRTCKTADKARIIGLMSYDIFEYNNNKFYPYIPLIQKINSEFKFYPDFKILENLKNKSKRDFFWVLYENKIIYNLATKLHIEKYRKQLKIKKNEHVEEIKVIKEYEESYIRQFQKAFSHAEKCVAHGNML